MAASSPRPFRTTSAIPGRIRIQITPKSARRGELEQIAEQAALLDDVVETAVVPDANSIIVRYEKRRPMMEMVRTLEDLTSRTLRTADRPAAVLNDTTAPAHFSPSEKPTGKVTGRQNERETEPLLLPESYGEQTIPAHRNGQSPQKFHLSIKHFIPGRMRLQVSQVRWNFRLAMEFEELLAQEPEVHSVETNMDGGFVIVKYDASEQKSTRMLAKVRQAMAGALHTLSGPAEQSLRRIEPPAEFHSKDLTAEAKPGLNPLVFPTVSIALSAVGVLPVAVVGVALALASIPTGLGAWEGLQKRRFNVAQLDFAALIALAALGQFLTGGIMTWLIGLGELIRMRTMRSSRRAISELMSPAGQTAWMEVDGTILSVKVDKLLPGNIVLVYPGDQIPVDGEIVEGRILVDQKLLTGESVPVAKEAGDPVFALTLVADGQARIRVEHIGSTTRAGQVVEMIENAPLSDTRVSNYAAKVGDRLVPVIFALAGGVFFLSADLSRLASILILDFVTGIRVSAPTTILSAMTGAAKQGVFIKGGKAMETLAEIDAIVFDKTGTLTHGSPYVTEVFPTDPDLSSDDILRLAASAEANLKHPAAKAIVDAALLRGLEVTPPENMEYAMGMGVYAEVHGRGLNVGSSRYMKQLDVDVSRAKPVIERSMASATSLVFVASEGRLIGMVAYSDPPREESAEVIQALRDRGIKRIVMLTGDNRRAAESVAGKLGITDIIAEAFPEQKADVVDSLRAEGYIVAVIGDGINDSPAFTRAHVGISLQHGADVAKETADVILLDGNLRGLPRAIDLSREAIAILKQNVNVIIAPTVLGMAAAAVGLSTPLISTIINNGTTVVTGLNALRPMFPSQSRMQPHPVLPPTITPMSSAEDSVTNSAQKELP